MAKSSFKLLMMMLIMGTVFSITSAEDDTETDDDGDGEGSPADADDDHDSREDDEPCTDDFCADDCRQMGSDGGQCDDEGCTCSAIQADPSEDEETTADGDSDDTA